MRKVSLFLLAILLCTVAFAIEKTALNYKLNNAALRFAENKGQVADSKGNLCPDILFTAHSGGAKLFVNHTGIHYQFMRQYAKPKDKKKQAMPSKFDIPEIDSTQTYRMDMKLIGANTNATVTHEGEGEDYENYYLAHCPNGILGVKNYQRITFQSIYPNIDWVLYSKGTSIEYDFIVHPGGNPKDIQINYDYATSLSLDEQGNLKAHTILGDVNESSPTSYQADGSKVDSKFSLSNNTLGFDIGNYDTKQNLVIDPSIAWATYYGGIGDDNASSVCTDATGNVYMGGETNSTLGIGSGGFQDSIGGTDDAFLVKFNSTGNRLWATYYGGSDDDGVSTVCIDALGNVYISGETSSTLGIASGGFQNTYAGNIDAFLVKFNSTGSRLWATYYGGSSDDRTYGVCTDATGNVYIDGLTSSTSGIASGGFQNTAGVGLYDAFLVKFDSAGNRLWATYYSGAGNSNGAYSVCTDAAGNIYMSGYTSSTSGIASGGFQNTYGGGTFDAILVKFNSAGNRLWGTYYGGASNEIAYSVCTDATGNVYMSGYTTSTSGIASGGFQNTYGGGGSDAFLVKLNSAGSRLWATYYGDTSNDYSYSTCTDASGNVYMAGQTVSTSGIASNGFQNTFGGGSDALLVKFDSAGNRIWATYYGGANTDEALSIYTDATGNVYLAGETFSASNIASSGFQNIFGGNYDAFLVKIKDTTNHTSIIDPAINTEIPIQLYPNPNTGEFTIELAQTAEVLSVYDLMGRVVYTQKDIATKTTINLPELSKGCYVVEVLSKEGRARKMVIVE